MVHINPDHFLQTPEGRVVTPKRNEKAWAQCHQVLADALGRAEPRTQVYVLIGPQGAGKSTWAARMLEQQPEAIVFDAILVKRTERAPILQACQAAGVAAVAIWFRTPIEVCIERNRARPADEIADEQGLRNVFAAIEPPTEGEGFASIVQIWYADA